MSYYIDDFKIGDLLTEDYIKKHEIGRYKSFFILYKFKERTDLTAANVPKYRMPVDNSAVREVVDFNTGTPGGGGGTENDPIWVADKINYSTTAQTTTLIDTKLASYPTTVEMNKAIDDTVIIVDDRVTALTGRVVTLETKVGALQNQVTALESRQSFSFRFVKTFTTPLSIPNATPVNLFSSLALTDITSSSKTLNHSLVGGVYKFHNEDRNINYVISCRIYGTYGQTGDPREFAVDLDYAVNPTAGQPISPGTIQKVNTNSNVITDKTVYNTYTLNKDDRFITEGTKLNLTNNTGTSLSITKIVIVFTAV